MGYVLDSCPTLHSCCSCVPLRLAVMLISGVGLWWAALYLFAFSVAGRDVFAGLGAPLAAASAMRFVHGAFGVLLCAAHALLFFAAVHQSDCLCELYIWFMAAFWASLLLSTAAVAVAAGVANELLFASLFPVVVLVAVCVSVYFTVVVANYRMTIP